MAKYYIKHDYKITGKDYVETDETPYSTDEQDTGLKWLDGKTIYEITLTGEITSSGYAAITPTGWEDLHVGTIVDIQGVCASSTGTTNIIGEYRTGTEWKSWVTVSSSTVAIDMGSAFTGGSYIITVRYTKTE